MGVKWQLIMVFICTSLITNYVEYTFMCLSVIYQSVYVLWRNLSSSSSPNFDLDSLLLNWRNSPYILGINPLSDANFQIFSPIFWAALPLSWQRHVVYKRLQRKFDAANLFIIPFVVTLMLYPLNHYQSQCHEVSLYLPLTVLLFYLVCFGLWSIWS